MRQRCSTMPMWDVLDTVGLIDRGQAFFHLCGTVGVRRGSCIMARELLTAGWWLMLGRLDKTVPNCLRPTRTALDGVRTPGSRTCARPSAWLNFGNMQVNVRAVHQLE